MAHSHWDSLSSIPPINGQGSAPGVLDNTADIREKQTKKEGKLSCRKGVESVYVSHVEDAVTFFAQPLSRIHDISRLSNSLAKACLSTSAVFGIPDQDKIYAGLFSADKCWYRCKVQHVVNDDQCAVTYIDYGNSEVLNRSSIVELPGDFQFAPIAQKYRLWGLQLQTSTDIEQGIKFLSSLIADKRISVQQKAAYKDGTAIVHVVHENLDIGEEVAKKGFAEKCKIVNSVEEFTDSPQSNVNIRFPWRSRKLEKPPMREPKSFPVFANSFVDQKASDLQKENLCSNNLPSVRSKNFPDKTIGNGMKSNQNLLDETKQLKSEKEVLLQKVNELEIQIQQGALQSEKEKALSEEAIRNLEKSLQSAVGNKLKILTSKIEILKNVRRENENMNIADDLLEAVSVVTTERLSALTSLNQLERDWTEYNLAQENIRCCSDVDKLDALTTIRDQIQQTLHSSVATFILEVDELPLEARRAKLQALLLSLAATYGASGDCEDLDTVFDDFFKWKQAKTMQFDSVRDNTNNSLGVLSKWFFNIKEFFDLTANTSLGCSEVVGNIDDILDRAESDISKELEISLVEEDEADRKIILNAYIRVVDQIQKELHLISVIQSKYSASVEFKKNIVEWIGRNPSVDYLMSIKKAIKQLKTQLRWKLVERSSLEEADEFNETALADVQNDITVLRNNIFSEIRKEQEEYGTLSTLVQKWFPELPLIYPEAEILRYMKSGGLLSGSMERDLLEAEPMKELSSKRPLVCSDVQNKLVLLKVYSVGVDTEEKVIDRASKYHKAWSEQKEDSGLMELICLFFCKSDPMVYLMVPFYPGESLGALQASKYLNSKEIIKVMSGVARGLQSLHAAGIIVGALHENNVFAVNREKGIVGDFDLTKNAEQRSSVTSACFPYLTAPELKLGQPASEFTDIFAYGCILLWLCTRKHNVAAKQDGMPDLDGLDIDAQVKDLLCGLLCSENRIRAADITAHECFKLADETVNVVADTDYDAAKSTPADFA
ncbi:serine/threonine-protein kinase 31 [Spea bombifrons]|uniref:serine/threonine-protein kinase 31 n=1 Tax=Spea bombifrons TaxID=233779 RepID=UPI00234AE758|nr:serine/threonine-protein kinase 31 [Spea bombifrons]